MKITGLRTDYFENPLGIESTQPLFYWRLESDRPGAAQTAYRIDAGSTPGGTDLWNSGRIESGETTHIPYGGSPLSSRQRVYWHVHVWDETGAETKSENAFFELGLLDKSEWQGEWIGSHLSGGASTTVPVPFLRRSFQLYKPVQSARLYASALGVYETELNGTRVGDQEFAPGWTDYLVRVQYQTYDVTSLLKEGENTWNAVLGDGWYSGHVGWRDRQFYGERPKFYGQLEVTYADGSRETIVTDQQWEYAFGPILESDLQMGESHDATQTLENWQPVKVSTEEKNHARVFSAPLGPPVRATEEITPIDVRKEGGSWIFDMGQNMVGRVRLKVAGKRGTTVRLRFAETLKDGPAATTGPIYIENLRSAKQTDHYTLSGNGEEVWEPKFTFHGFRYVEVTGYPGEPGIEAITGVVLHSDNAKTGDFECSDALVNQLQKNIDWGWRGNSLEVPTDCPQRNERLGWTGDAQVFIRTSAFNRDVAGFWREWARDTRDAQDKDGHIPSVVPDAMRAGNAHALPTEQSYDGGPAWADAVLICPWTIYRTYGDKRILEENYESFIAFIEYQRATSRAGLRCYDDATYFKGYGDWLALDGSGLTDGGTPKELLGTAFYAHGANLVSQIAKILGKDEDAAKYAGLFEEIKAVFVRRYVTAEGLMSPPYQTPYLLALHFDLLPQELRASVAAQLVRDIRRNGNKLSTGFVGSPYINHELTREGHLDVAYELLFQKQWPSWLYAVTQNATTIWERWDGWTHDKGFQSAGMNSFNHYAYGAIGAWLYQVVAGIELDPVVPGYRKFQLKPQPGSSLTSAKAHLDTLHGRIESEWTVDGDTFNWKFTVPPNTLANVTLPNGETFEAKAGTYEKSVKL